MRETSRFRGLPLFGFAVAGLVLGHLLSYQVAIPDPHHRDLVLDRSGHGYLPTLAQVAVVLAIAAVATVAGRALTSRPGPEGSYAALARRLAIVQVAAFGGQELLERLVAGAPLGDLVKGHLLLAGVTAQVVVALAGAALLRWLARTSQRLAHAATSAFPFPCPVLAFAMPAPPDAPRGRVKKRSHGERAPPSV
jgi:hypothetical protein